MKQEFDLRLKMFQRSLGVLELPESTAVWQNQPPVMFTKLEAEAETMVGVLVDHSRKQEADTTGVTMEKQREEAELEDAAFALGVALTLWFRKQNSETEAEQVSLTESAWRKLAGQELLNAAQRVIDHATALSSGPAAAAVAEYGITPAAVQALQKEWDDFDQIINSPGVAQTLRKVLTKGLRPAFNLVEAKFTELEALMVQFRKTEAGRAMIAAWDDARIQKGANGGKDPTAPAPPAPEK